MRIEHAQNNKPFVCLRRVFSLYTRGGSVNWIPRNGVEMGDENAGTPPGPGPPSLLPSSIDPSKSIMVDHGSSSGPSSTAAAEKCPQPATEDEEEKRALLEIKPSPNTRRDR
uniref:Uncharacterized protein n=1 Tax=Strigamia maritima TaxID=126957 RepID=T1J2I0_STRMM